MMSRLSSEMRRSLSAVNANKSARRSAKVITAANDLTAASIVKFHYRKVSTQKKRRQTLTTECSRSRCRRQRAKNVAVSGRFRTLKQSDNRRQKRKRPAPVAKPNTGSCGVSTPTSGVYRRGGSGVDH